MGLRHMAETERLHGGPDVLGVPRHDFSTNSNACGPCPTALAAVQAADASHYPDPGYHALRESLAAFHQVAPERVLLAGSASEFIFRISSLVAHPGFRSRGNPAAYALPERAYGDYAQAARAWGLERVDSERDASLIWACEPSSPLGQPHAGLQQQVDALRQGQLLVLDRAYAPLRLQGQSSLDAAGLDRVWQLWTPNKALGLTGVRAAYAIAPLQAGDLVERLQALAPSWPVGAHGVAMLQCWTTAAAQDWLEASLATLRAWKQRQLDLCQCLGWQVLPSEANYFVARPASADLGHDLGRLRAQGIKLRDATSFGLPGRVRLGVLPPAAHDALARAWTTLTTTRNKT
jgi:histidinol-phosphate aminotransferase